jgi:type I restriction enzyme S subunit
VIPGFLFYYLRVPEIRAYIEDLARGSAQPNLSAGDAAKLMVPAPPIEEQRAIAETLGALDDRIDNLRQTNATLQTIAAALFKSRFVDFDGVPPEKMQKSELGLIPKGWRVATVGEYFHLTMGQSPPGHTYNEHGDGVPFYQGRADFGTRFPAERVYCTAPTRLAKKGDVLVSVRAPVGDMNVALNDCAIGRGVAAVHHECASFALYVLQSLRSAFKQFESEGTVFGSINKKQFSALKFVAPPDHSVREFQAIVQPMDERIENNERQAATLAALRDTLLPRLISGRLRVRGAE